LVITGAQGAFCSGGDLSELHHYPSQRDGARLAAVMGDALASLESLPISTIAAVEGPAIGGGAEITLACDLRVVAEDAVIGFTHLRLGITPAWGGALRLRRSVGYSLAYEWMATARHVHAEEAARVGLANRVTQSGATLDTAIELAREIIDKDPAALQALKRILRCGVENSHEEATQLERSAFAPLWAAPAHLAASERFVSRKNHPKKA
jgi:enoyl-CoA hydratase